MIVVNDRSYLLVNTPFARYPSKLEPDSINVNVASLANLAKRLEYHWVLANLTVAALCLIPATYCSFTGRLFAGIIIILVSFLAVLNADHHERKAKRLRE